jgi:lipopolysaccharide transport system ATP-binding protein
MSKKEVDRKFDEIVAFAEIEKFIDTPVKHYSSGMYLRLAFAVAAHLETEILLVDEVLAVGDAEFQKKCLQKVGGVAREGRTVLFVSHSMAAVASLCTTAVLLEDGSVKAQGPPVDVISGYLTSRTNVERVDLSVADRRGSGEVRIVEAHTRNAAGQLCSSFMHGEDITFEFTLEPTIAAKPVMICVVWIKTATGVPVLHLASHDDPSAAPVVVDGRKEARCVLKDCKLYPGTYLVSFWVGPTHRHDTDLVMDVLQLRIEQGPLLVRGFDMSWSNAIFHSPSSWTIKDAVAPASEEADGDTACAGSAKTSPGSSSPPSGARSDS